MGFADKIKEISSSFGGFAKPEELQKAEAVLIEFISFERQRPTPYGPKDSIEADITVFDTQADIDAGKPSKVMKAARIEGYTVLVDRLSTLEKGDAVIKKIIKGDKGKQGKPPWLFADVTPAAREGVINYGIKRDEEIEAALAAAPSFD